MAQPHNKKLGEYPMTTRGREQGPEKRYRRLRFPAFTAAKWTTANPLLQRGELGVETDTRKIKVGDGITYWNDLEYAKAYSDWGNIAGDITEQTDLVDFVNAAVAAEANIRSQADQQLQANIDNVAADLSTHEQDTNNPHNVTKAQVGLGNVDNTADINKPVSTAQSEAITNAVSTHNNDTTAHSNQFSLYRKSSEQDTIDAEINDTIANLELMKANTDYVNNELDKKQNISNLSQSIDTSTDKYPSNNAVKTAIDNIDALPDQTGQGGKVLTTNGTTASWEVIDIPENVVVSDNYVNAKTWKGTKAEYDALGTYDDNTTYFIIDDYQNITYNDLSNKPQINSIELSGNKSLDDLSIQNKLIAGENITIVGNTISATGLAKTDLSNISSNIDYVVESQEPTEANGYTWYRKYKSGWVEQGGYVSASGDSEVSTTYPIELQDPVCPDVNLVYEFQTDIFVKIQQVVSMTTTGFTTRGKAVNNTSKVWENGNFYWKVFGKSIQGV